MASKADTLWEDVLEHVEANEREEALELCRQITSMDPNHGHIFKKCGFLDFKYVFSKMAPQGKQLCS